MAEKVSTGFSIRIFPSGEELAEAVADRITALAREKRQEGRAFVLGLAAGSSPEGVYRRLVLRIKEGKLDFSHCKAFCLDEYYPIDPASSLSFKNKMSEVAGRLGISSNRFHIPRGDVPRERVEAHCVEYEEEIRNAGGIDFQILGIGRSGHIGFNEPGSLCDSKTRLVHLDNTTEEDAAKAFGGIKNVPKQAITMGIRTILDSREIVLLALGRKKAEIIKQVVENSPNSDLPASFIKLHTQAAIYLDEEASWQISTGEK